MEVDPNELTEVYLRHRRSRSDDDFWAWEEVRRIVGNGLDAGWKVTLQLLEKATSDDDIEYIAVGPLEDLIDMHGHKAFDLIEPECESNIRLRLALSTVGVLFYYGELDRWYNLLCKYGFRQLPVSDGRAVVEEVMDLMKSYLDQKIGVGHYGKTMEDLLRPEPLRDKAAQKLLQGAYWDFERLESERQPPYKFTESELRARLRESLAELESLGYRANANSLQGHKT